MENGTQETQQTTEPQNLEQVSNLAQVSNTIPAPAEGEGIKALLGESKDQDVPKAPVTVTDTAKDARIAALEAALSEATKAAESLRAEGVAISGELTQVKAARDTVLAKYLTLTKASNPSIMPDMIAGDTIEQIDASVAKARAIVESVRKTLEAEAAALKVPAGAPPRGAISLEGLSPREKIAAGISRLCRETGGG